MSPKHTPGTGIEAHEITGEEAARILGKTARWLRELTAGGWIVRPYTVGGVVQGYARWRDDSEKRNAKSVAANRVDEAKAALLEQRLARESGQWMKRTELLDSSDEFVGRVVMALQTLPARIAGRDVPLQRRVEDVVHQLRNELADQYKNLEDEAGRAAIDLQRARGRRSHG